MLFQDIVFWLLSVLAIGAALGVVIVKDLFRTSLLLVLVFIAVAGFFVLVAVVVETKWELIAGPQQSKAQAVQTSSVRTLASPGELAGLERAGFATESERTAAQEAGLADLLIGDFVLPFEAVSLLLLAAVIGALALVRPR